MLSDLHNQVYGKGNHLLLDLVRQLNPDLVIAAGDMLNADLEKQEWIALSLLKNLVKEFPVYYANGNHEYRMKLDTKTYGLRYEVYAHEARKAGINLLENEYTDINIKGLPMRIYGLEIPWKFYKRVSRAKLSVNEMKACLGNGSTERYKLLIAHNPMCFQAYTQWGAHLTLSGHLHGGFMRFPVIGGVVSPQFQIFPKYDRGIFCDDGKYMIVSAGVGTHSKIPRIGNPVELAAVDLD